MTDDATVEAVARAFWETAQRIPIAWDDAPEGSRQITREKTRAAIAALPPEMRAATEMRKALNRLEHCASAAALWMTHHPAPGMGDKRDPLALAITEARAALSRALALKAQLP
jgi:hypothetical protein